MSEADDLLVWGQEFLETLRAPDALTGEQLKEMQAAANEKAELDYARRQIEDSYLPGWKAYAIEAGADIVSPIARLVGQGDYADRMNRFAEKVEQAASERDEQGWMPAIVKRGLRGAGRSLTTMVPAAAATGGYGAIALASAQESNRAWTEGKDAGLTGKELAGYVVAQGVVEGAPAAVMQRVGLGGVEKLLAGKKTVSAGVAEGLKRLGITAVQELPEELFTEISHAVTSQLAGVDPNALDKDSLKQLVADTTVQTIITVGMSHAITAGKPGQEDAGAIARRIMDSVGAGKELSRGDAESLGLPQELVKSKEQRNKLTGELTKLIASPAMEGPTAATEADLGPEGVETPLEAPGALEEPVEPPRLLDPQEGDNEYVSLSKQGGNQIREVLGLDRLGEEAVQTHDMVMAKVIADKADEGAVGLAETVLKNKRMTTTHEHAAMVLKAWKLMDVQEQAQADMAEATNAGSEEAFERAERAETAAVKDLDTLTMAQRFARREVARSMDIGNLKLSRQSFDVADILNALQARKGTARPVTEAEQKQVAKLSGKGQAALEGVAKEKARIRREEAEASVNKAENVVAANKPKKGLSKSYGQKLKDKAAQEREDIKKAIRQMGLRVNDIAGLAPEAAYLIGRLALAYVKSGVGVFTDLVSQMQNDMPDLNLSTVDVADAINMKNPALQEKQTSEATKRVRRIRSMGRMISEIDSLSKGIAPEGKRKGPANITEDMKKMRKKLTKARLEFFAADLDAAKLARAVQIVDQLQEQIANGLTTIKEAPKEIPPQIKAVREYAQQLRRELKVDEELASLKRQMETGEFEEKIVREKKPIDDRLAAKQIELAKIRKEYNQMLADAVPKTIYGRVKEIAALAKSIKATADLSFTMRQNVWQMFAHPIRSTGLKKKRQIIGKVLRGEELVTDDRFFPALSAFFSENAADEIYNAMVNGPNGFLYAKSGLAVLDASSPDAQQRSEVFRSNALERSKVPVFKQLGAVMKASSRHAVAVGNLIRTSAFDAFLDQNPNATPQELAAFADYVNVSTGLGNLGKAGAIAEELNLVFFSPKFAISRVQTPLAVIKHWKQPRVRKAIAKDMVRFAATGALVLALAKMAGFDVEWADPDDPDWFKFRFGDTRIDIWGGFQQPMRVIFRTASVATGQSDIDPVEIAGRFVSYKLAPIVTFPVEFFKGETAVGEETTKMETTARALVPLVLEDIHEAWTQSGPGAALATGALATLGVGVATYPDNQTAVRRRLKNFRARGWHGKANALKAKWNRENPKSRIIKG